LEFRNFVWLHVLNLVFQLLQGWLVKDNSFSSVSCFFLEVDSISTGSLVRRLARECLHRLRSRLTATLRHGRVSLEIFVDCLNDV